MATVIIPTPLRKFTQNQAQVQIQGETIGAGIQSLAEQFPALKAQILDGQGNLRSFVRVYLGEEDIKSLQGDETPLADGAEVSIIPAIAGGI